MFLPTSYGKNVAKCYTKWLEDIEIFNLSRLSAHDVLVREDKVKNYGKKVKSKVKKR